MDTRHLRIVCGAQVSGNRVAKQPLGNLMLCSSTVVPVFFLMQDPTKQCNIAMQSSVCSAAGHMGPVVVSGEEGYHGHS